MAAMTSLALLALAVSAPGQGIRPVPTETGTRWVEYGGGAGPGKDKHIVLVSGDEEYRSEEALPMLAKILADVPGIADDPASPFWWAVIFGANLGGNITPIGSASTLVAVTIIHKYELQLSFVDFVRKAVPFAAMQIALALVYVLVVMKIFS